MFIIVVVVVVVVVYFVTESGRKLLDTPAYITKMRECTNLDFVIYFLQLWVQASFEEK